ncbi:RIP metalloprotease RseP, partial [candidate division KSB1 bacterium]|nr:RIP metalloprotease RseP [candidate division KSB1 bacterium]NIW68804.1 RIP metalloprotease RseP [candidate division KSB1 bacterium]NIX70390.1 RIP metalloprotease RseP [candidate division KSB1 bacterium]
MWEGARLTGELTRAIFFALGDFFAALFVGEANLDEIAGPVGIVGIVGDTSELGFVHVITLTALISINLAIINMIP